MSHPDRPTLRDYLACAESQTFHVAVAEVACGEQRLIAATITPLSGARAIELAEDLGDALMSTSVAQLDRRLGTKSHLFE